MTSDDNDGNLRGFLAGRASRVGPDPLDLGMGVSHILEGVYDLSGKAASEFRYQMRKSGYGSSGASDPVVIPVDEESNHTSSVSKPVKPNNGNGGENKMTEVDVPEPLREEYAALNDALTEYGSAEELPQQAGEYLEEQLDSLYAEFESVLQDAEENSQELADELEGKVREFRQVVEHGNAEFKEIEEHLTGLGDDARDYDIELNLSTYDEFQSERVSGLVDSIVGGSEEETDEE